MIPLNRRNFLASALTAPMVLRSGLAQRKDKVRLAVIGVADRGAANLAGVAEEEIVALCEIDEPRAVAARKQFPNAQFFVDYRVMFDKVMNKIDAVVISTPDHSHCLPALLAMAQKKHVYCEKPLAHTVQEVRLMQAAAARAKVITQMGTQIHAGENYRRVVEIVQSGVLGAIERVDVWCSRRPDGGRKLKPVQKVKFDPDLWCGPVDSDFFYATHANWPHFHWRWWWEFGGGVHADMGCHFTDLAHWALNLGAPISISAEGQSIPNADNGVPWVLKVDYMYPKTEQRPAIPLTWYHGVPGPDLTGKTRYPGFNDGVFFTGSKAKLVANYSKYQLLPEEFAQDFKAPPKTIPASIGHHREWLEAIRGNGKALCDFGYSGTLAEAVLLGNVAYRSGGKLTWDTNTGKISGGDNPDAYLSMTPRQGWEYPKI